MEVAGTGVCLTSVLMPVDGAHVVIDDIEYVSVGRCSVMEFEVGDRIGADLYLVTESKPHSASNDWSLTWIHRYANEAAPFTYVGSADDQRWVPVTPKEIIIDEEEDLFA